MFQKISESHGLAPIIRYILDGCLFISWLFNYSWLRLTLVAQVVMKDPLNRATGPCIVESGGRGHAFYLLDSFLGMDGGIEKSADLHRVLSYFWRNYRICDQTRQNLADLLCKYVPGFLLHEAAILTVVHTDPLEPFSPTLLVVTLETGKNRISTSHDISSPSGKLQCTHRGTFKLNGADLSTVFDMILGRRKCQFFGDRLRRNRPFGNPKIY